MKRHALLAVFALLASPAATEEIDCKDPQYQSEMNLCAQADYETADAELNATWKGAMAKAKELDAGEPEEQRRGAAKALLAGQRGWIAYRDGQCELDGWNAHGGTMEPMLVAGCMAMLTRARTKELKDFTSGLER